MISIPKHWEVPETYYNLLMHRMESGGPVLVPFAEWYAPLQVPDPLLWVRSPEMFLPTLPRVLEPGTEIFKLLGLPVNMPLPTLVPLSTPDLFDYESDTKWFLRDRSNLLTETLSREQMEQALSNSAEMIAEYLPEGQITFAHYRDWLAREFSNRIATMFLGEAGEAEGLFDMDNLETHLPLRVGDQLAFSVAPSRMIFVEGGCDAGPSGVEAGMEEPAHREMGSSTACFDCGKLIPTGEVYISQQYEYKALCDECFQKAVAAGRAKEVMK